MTRDRLNGTVGLALKVSTIAALLGSPIAAYVAVSSKVGIIEYKLDDYARETRELRAAVTALQLAHKDLIKTDDGFAREILELRVRTKQVKARE